MLDNTTIQVSGHVDEIGRLRKGVAAAIAVVPTMTVTACGLPLICTEGADNVHIAGGAAAGVMAQLRFMVPEKDPLGVRLKVKLAFCPGVMLCELGEGAAIAKSGARGGVVFSMTAKPLATPGMGIMMSGFPSPFMSLTKSCSIELD